MGAAVLATAVVARWALRRQRRGAERALADARALLAELERGPGV